MTTVKSSIASEFRRYRALGEEAMAQLTEEELNSGSGEGGNAVAAIAWHVAGNLASRFTDFLDSDGEKPWRDREEEFADRTRSGADILAHWRKGWDRLGSTLATLADDDLERTVVIRRTEMTVAAALARSLAHTSYHVGQIVFLAKSFRGEDWQSLSIPPGGSQAYNENPDRERADDHAHKLEDGPQDQDSGII